ncbi:Gfo/Idh/MocA family protein [Loktanella sp. 3ANDIMAR09]|uniref:Gfo/Idh/MocA family protein n=1 Tax=Loktanella sp. 3ANDIMAR09 TaxID=1225657 RepID=UPI000ADB18A6|nr:Gfo/Idh/MocA family oxidoreductase [Loktanella sp. 3ANDIMAR09]
MSDPIRVLIVGTGGMAHAHASAYQAMEGVELVGGVDRNPENLHEFNAQYGITHGFDSVIEAIQWGEFDAVSNVTPDAVHFPTTMPLLAAGKHVLCEKPLAVTYADAAQMAVAAQAAGVVNMVNLTYRNIPAIMEAQRLVASGAIGEVRHFEASYLQSWLTQPAWGKWDEEEQWLWRLSSKHGSLGVLGDVGVHILDFATFVAGADSAAVSCRLRTFDKAPGGQIGAYVLDANDSATMQVQLTNGAIGVVHASRYASGHMNDLRLRVFGTEGGLDVRWEDNQSVLRACLGDQIGTAAWEYLEVPPVQTNYVRFIEAIRAGQSVLPDFARGATLQRALDAAVLSDGDGCRDIVLG